MLTERLANGFDSSPDLQRRLNRFRTFTTYAWPLLSCLVPIPLFYVGRMLYDGELAIRACLLYIFVPSVCLVTLHTDQVFFPTLFTGTVLLAGLAARSRSTALAVVTGVATLRHEPRQRRRAFAKLRWGWSSDSLSPGR